MSEEAIKVGQVWRYTNPSTKSLMGEDRTIVAMEHNGKWCDFGCGRSLPTHQVLKQMTLISDVQREEAGSRISAPVAPTAPVEYPPCHNCGGVVTVADGCKPCTVRLVEGEIAKAMQLKNDQFWE